MTAARNSVSCGDWEISFTVQGEGPALVLLHGGSPGASGASNFHANVQVLAKRFTTYVMDFPGWGASSKNLVSAGTWGNPLEAGGKAVLAFMQAVGIGKAHLMGSSFGGAAALHAAMLRPDSVDRLVLMAPGGGIPRPGTAGPALSKLFGYYAGEGPSLAKFAGLAHDLVFDKSRISQAWLQERYEASLDKEITANPPLRLPPGYVPQPAQALCNDPRLAQLRSSVLFMWGANDEVQPVSCLESFSAIPRQDAVILGECGHLPYWEQADKVNELALWFLSRN